MSRTKIASGLVLACAVALAGCSGGGTASSDGGLFSKPFNPFETPDWAKPASVSRTSDLGPSGPAGPDDLVGPDGRCGAVAVPVAQPEAGAAVTPGDSLAPGGPTVLGGVALGMTECQTVQRAGTPGNVAISAGDKGERSVVLTYVSGPWPGIYRFNDGRLKVIDRAPAPPAPPKAPPKKKAPAKKSAPAR